MPSQSVSAYTVVRELLTENFDLSSEEILASAKTRGVTQPDTDVRKIINKTRSDMRARQKKSGKKPSGPSMYTAAREILTAEPDLSNDDALTRIKSRGITRADGDIRVAIRSTRHEIQKRGAQPIAAAARVTAEPKALVPMSDESALFASVGRANTAARLCGGVVKAREIAEAIRACGGIDAFLKRLDVVAEILESDTEM